MGKMEEGQDKRRLVGEGREIWEWEEHGKAEGQGERGRGEEEGGSTGRRTFTRSEAAVHGGLLAAGAAGQPYHRQTLIHC